MPKKIVFLCLAALVCIMAFSCSPPANPAEPTHYFITGHMYDSLNGAPVSGATFRYGDASGISGSDGAFSIDMGTTADVRSEPMGFSAPGYSFMYINPARVDLADANDVVVRLKPLTDVLYMVKSLQCKIYDDSAVEITDDVTVTLAVLPRNGIYTPMQVNLYDDARACYYFESRTHSSDCLVLAWIAMPDPADSFFVHKTGVDLNGPEPIQIRFDEPDTGYSDVALTVDTIQCTAGGFYMTPYGLLPILAKFTDGGVLQVDGQIDFTDGTVKTVSVYNPGNWQCLWSQQSLDAGYVGAEGGIKRFMSTTAIAAPSPAITIPALDTGIGPGEDPVLASWTYDSAAGAISVDAVAGAQLYQFSVFDNLVADPINFGTIVSFSSSASLPAWVNGIVKNDSPRTMLMSVMATDLAAYDLELVSRDTYPPSTRFGVLSQTPAMPFIKEFSF